MTSRWSLCVILLSLVLCSLSERVWEQGTSSHIHDHGHTFEQFDGAEDEPEDEHRGIPVVEDDVPEWVKLTFADKFIALGEAEFISLSEGGDVKDEGEYEYIYSDEEGFEFDPSRDEIVSDPHKDRRPAAKLPDEDEEVQAEVKLPTIAGTGNKDSGDEDDLQVDDEVDSDMIEMVKAVKKHRESIDQAKAHADKKDQTQEEAPQSANSGFVSVPIHIDGEEGNSVSFLETGATKNKAPSHEPGTRRNRLRKQTQKQDTPTPTDPLPGARNAPNLASTIPPSARVEHRTPSMHFSSRYSVAGGSVGLNPHDPRLKHNKDSMSLIDQTTGVGSKRQKVDADEDLVPLAKDSQERAQRHKNWLHTHMPPGEREGEVKLPSLEKHMYSNGLPVADWEVGYVDGVLDQFGY